VLVFIDNLDRCQPSYVVELLEGIQTIFADVRVTYLVAADREWVAHSFEVQYGPLTDVMGRPGRPLEYLFLEKTFAVSAPLPQPGAEAQARYWEAVLQDGPQRPERVVESDRQAATEKLAGLTLDDVVEAVEELGAASTAEARALREAAAIRVVEATTAGEQDHELRPYPRTDGVQSPVTQAPCAGRPRPSSSPGDLISPSCWRSRSMPPASWVTIS